MRFSTPRLSACYLLFIDVARAVRALQLPDISVACDCCRYGQVLVTAAGRHQGLGIQIQSEVAANPFPFEARSPWQTG